MSNSATFVLNVVTLGVTDLPRSMRFYEALGFIRKFREAGDTIAFFDAGSVIVGLFRWDMLAADAGLPDEPRPQTFHGTTLACLCGSDGEVDALMARASRIGARVLKPADRTSFGGYSGYFADPDGHAWEIVRAPGFSFLPDGRVVLPD